MDIVQLWLDALPPDKKMEVLTRKDDIFGHTPLHVAALYCHLDVAELLIEHGAGKISCFFVVGISLVPSKSA